MALFIQSQFQEFITRFRDVAFLIDFDGTLVELVPKPSDVNVPEDLIKDLGVIAHADACTFAIVTGRSLAQLDIFLGGVIMPALGSHGAECRPHRDAEIELSASALPASICDAILDVSDRHSCYFENKIYSLSLHLPFTHADDDIEAELAAALGDERKNYAIRKIGRTYEIMQSGVTKGSGIIHLMQQPGFSGRRPIYIGDDVNMDDSLNVVTKLGGILIPARHLHHQPSRSDDSLLEASDVRLMVSMLRKAAQP